jgi:hypothetical protein
MSNWILKATEDYLMPVYEQLHAALLKRDVLHADETTLQVLHEPGKSLRVTAICGCIEPAVIQINPLFCMNTNRDEAQSIRKSSLLDTRVSSIRMAMPDIMTWEKILLLLDVGLVPGESLTRQ